MKTLHWYAFYPSGSQHLGAGASGRYSESPDGKALSPGVPFTDKRMIRMNEILIRRKKILPGTGGFVSPSSFQRHAGPERLKARGSLSDFVGLLCFPYWRQQNPVPSSS